MILLVIIAAPLLTALAAWVQRSLSRIEFGAGEVRITNFPGRTRGIPISAIDRFDQVASETARHQLRRVTAVLVLENGQRVPVLAAGDPETTGSATALNNRLESLRASAA